MKQYFKIINEKQHKITGYLIRDTETNNYEIRLLKSYKDIITDGIILCSWLNHIKIMNTAMSNHWVQLRVIDPHRQGIDWMLRKINMNKYYIYDLLMYSNGRCGSDDQAIVEICKKDIDLSIIADANNL